MKNYDRMSLNVIVRTDGADSDRSWDILRVMLFDSGADPVLETVGRQCRFTGTKAEVVLKFGVACGEDLYEYAETAVCGGVTIPILKMCYGLEKYLRLNFRKV